MHTESERRVAATLEAARDELLQQTASALYRCLPMVAVPPFDTTSPALHQQHMATTACRFHELVQVAATLDWSLVAHEYDWTRRRLSPFGITWEHQRTLIAAYFDAARALVPWQADDRATLDAIAARLLEIGALVHRGG